MVTEARNLYGQKIGRKGGETRRRIMAATLEMLKHRSYKDLSVSEVAAEAEVSSSTFYVYFVDIEEVLYACVQAAALDLGALHAVLDEDWDAANLQQQVKRFVETYNDLWEQYRVELRVRNLEADQGNLRFLNLRIETTQSLLQKLGKKIARLNPDLQHPNHIAVAVHAAMSALASQQDIAISGTTRHTRKQIMAGVEELLCKLCTP